MNKISLFGILFFGIIWLNSEILNEHSKKSTENYLSISLKLKR